MCDVMKYVTIAKMSKLEYSIANINPNRRHCNYDLIIRNKKTFVHSFPQRKVFQL